VVVEGLPAGLPVDTAALAAFLARRAPGRDPAVSTPRREPDAPEFLSGLRDGRTCGAPVAALIRNVNAHPADYAAIADLPRPGHADLAARVKYGGANDPSGGGAFSGRLTAPLCIAGGLCLQFLARAGVSVFSRIAAIGPVSDPAPLLAPPGDPAFPVVTPALAAPLRAAIADARANGDSLGGIVECLATGLPPGLGGPLFGGLDALLAAAVFAIPAVKGLEFGDGFAAAAACGSGNNDPFVPAPDGSPVPASNHAGGLLGGITTGAPLRFRVAFKPTPSIARPQQTVDLRTGRPATLSVPGRHDPCIVPRAAPAVEAAAAIALYDALLERRKDAP
ncbi:MAG: chorismate synthase, partial [Kiritimatiellae bacterium]|nr:chorismate synthase [Kiritimatiellia bacterium]